MVEQAQVIPPPSPGAGEYLEQAMAWSDEVRAGRRGVRWTWPTATTSGRSWTSICPRLRIAASAAPVLLFFHGGYWVIGHKDLMGFMAPAITSAPALLVPVGYRMAPGAKYPQQVDDCRAALRWVYGHVAELRRRP